MNQESNTTHGNLNDNLPTDCPNEAQLQQLLAGQLKLSQENELERHVADCEYCQLRIEELTGHADQQPIDRLIDVYADRLRADSVNKDRVSAVPTAPAATSFVMEAQLPSLPGYDIHEVIARGGMGVFLKRQISN